MATRTVFLRFGSNVNSFAADMQRAAVATREVEAAGQKLAAAQIAHGQAAETLAKQQIEGELRVAAAHEAEADAMAAAVRRDAGSLAQRQAMIDEAAAATEAAVLAEGTALAEATVAYRASAVAVEEAEAEKVAAVEASAAAREAAQQKAGKYALIGGAIVLAGLYEAGKAAVEFQADMAQAAAVSQVTRGNLAQMSDEVLRLSTVMPVSAHDFAAALVVVEQAGYQGYQALNLLQVAAEGSVIGLTDTKTAAGDIAKVLNGFGMAAGDAAYVNEILVASVQNGIGTYHNFGESLAQVAPLAKAAGISLADVAATVTVLSTKGMEASAAGMGLIRLVFQMAKEGTATSNALVNLAKANGYVGVTSGEAALEAMGLTNTIAYLGSASGGTLDEIAKFSPSVRQARAAIALLSDQGRGAIEMMAKFSDRTYLANTEMQAYAVQQKTAANQTQLAKNEIKAAEIQLGNGLLPVVASVARVVGDLAMAFADLPGPLKTAVTIGGALVGTMAVMAGLVTILGPGFSVLATAMGLTAAAEDEVAAGEIAMEAASGPIGLIIAGVSALVIGLGMFGVQSAEAQKRAEAFTDAINKEKSGVDGAVNSLIQHNLVNSGNVDAMNKYGVAIDDVTASIQAQGAGTDAQKRLTDKFIETMGYSTEALTKQGISARDIARIHGDVANAVNGDTSAMKDIMLVQTPYNTALYRTNDLLSSVSQQRKDYLKGQKDADAANQLLFASQSKANLALILTGDSSGIAADDMKKLVGESKELQNTMKGFVDSGNALSEALDRTKASTKAFADGGDVFKEALSASQKDIDAQAQAMADSYNAALDAQTQAAQDFATDVSRTNQDIKTSYGAMGDSSAAANASVTMGLRDSTNAAKDNATAVSRANKEARKSASDFKDQVGTASVAMETWLSGLDTTAQANAKWNADLVTIAQRGGTQELITSLRNLGKDGVPLVAEFASSVGDEIDRANSSIASLSTATEASFADFEAVMTEQIDKEQQFESNLAILASRGMGALAQQFYTAGPKAAKALADAVALDPSDPSVVAANAKALTAGQIGGDGYTVGFKERLDVLGAYGYTSGQDVGHQTSQGMSDYLAANGIELSPEAVEMVLRSMKDQIGGDNLYKAILGTFDQEYKSTDASGHTVQLNANGSVRYFAEGGEHHVAQFAKGGDWRVWAEPETGGEAYIPLGMNKRTRSTALLDKVAGGFGYDLAPKGAPAGAGMVGAGARGGDTKVVYVTVKQPTSQQTTYQFTGPIQGYKLEDVQRDADRKSRLAALARV